MSHFLIAVLNVISSLLMLGVIKLNVIMLNVVAPIIIDMSDEPEIGWVWQPGKPIRVNREVSPDTYLGCLKKWWQILLSKIWLLLSIIILTCSHRSDDPDTGWIWQPGKPIRVNGEVSFCKYLGCLKKWWQILLSKILLLLNSAKHALKIL